MHFCAEHISYEFVGIKFVLFEKMRNRDIKTEKLTLNPLHIWSGLVLAEKVRFRFGVYSYIIMLGIKQIGITCRK